MANQHEPHFFKSLLPGYHSGLTIPLGFNSKHIEGETNLRTWTLRSDASHKTWEVIQEGRRLSRGWKDFTLAHDLRIGDIVLFKKEGEMVFHVTLFGPSCCEINYTNTHGDDAADGAEVTPPLSWDYCFLAEVIASNLSEDKLHLPVEATRCTALKKQCGEELLVNKEGKSWSVTLRFYEAGGLFYIRKGWRRFCVDNRCTVGDLFVFNMVGDGKTSPLLCVCPESKECTEILTNYFSNKNGLDVSASTSSSRPFTGRTAY